MRISKKGKRRKLKTTGPGLKRYRNQRDQLADDLVDDNLRGIAAIDDLLRSPGAEDADHEEHGDNDEKGEQVQAARITFLSM